MIRISIALLALAMGAVGPVRAQDRKVDRLASLKSEFRGLEVSTPGFAVLKAKRLRILRAVTELRDIAAVKFLVDVSREPRYADLLDELLRLLAKRLPDEALVGQLFKERMALDDPHRLLARDYLLRQAVRRRDDAWLATLLSSPVVEDRFLALRGLGRIGSMRTLAAARRLLEDDRWKPVRGTVISCSTIAGSLRELEGAPAARLLLLLQRDPRFGADDAEALRAATRLWSRRDLQTYIDLSDLAHPDAAVRAESARFMGDAGIEAARAPLLAMARSPLEDGDVRAAAARALGGLKIARGHLAVQLAELLRDRYATVKRGAVEGLARLRVRQAVKVLVGLLGGPLDKETRRALARSEKHPPGHDWREWLEGDHCPLPDGT